MHRVLTYSWWHRLYVSKNEVERLLLLSVGFSIGLCCVRVGYTGKTLFLWLIWNLFLAYVPYLISKSMIQKVAWIEHTGKCVLLFIVWLLFIPNAFYIITDLFHLQERGYIPLWFDLALIFSFAWNGLLLGILSVRQMEKIFVLKTGYKSEALFILPIMFLNAFGIYLGRYLRYNSWDVVSNPFGLAEDMLYLFVHPLRHRFDWSMIVCYAVLMALMYTTIKKVSKAVW